MVRLVLVVVVALGAACGGSGGAGDATPAHDSPTTDASGSADAPRIDGPRLDARVGEPRTLGLNDISMLFQLPENPISGTTIARLTGVPGFGQDLVPRAVFAQLVSAPGDVGHAFEEFHLVALRFDLCDRQLGPCPSDADGRLRLVFQPVFVGSPWTEAADVAIHAFYPVPAAELAQVVNELRALARLRDFQTASPVAIDDFVASTSPPSEYRTRLRALIARYAVADQLVRLSLFAQDATEPPFNWVFRAVERSGASFVPLPIPAIAATQQRTILVYPGYDSTPSADVPAGFELAADADAFAAATTTERRGALAALAAADNPTLNTFATEPCVTCHAATFLLTRRAQDAGIDPDTIENVYTSTHDLSTQFGISATTATSLRAFGWHGRYAAISQRVVNETALALDEIEQRYPPGDPGTLPDAAMPDAMPMVERVFVASIQRDGDLATAGGGVDGLDGADRLCAMAATSAGLGGTWVAWLSTSTVAAIDRITGDGPWYLVDGTTLVFPNKAAILTGPLVPIDRDEHGAQPPGAENVWTGTAADGTAIAGQSCLDWTSNSSSAIGSMGLRSATTAAWTEYNAVLCSNHLNRLYCFER